MSVALKAGLIYFIGVFAMGFILGALRSHFLVPLTGPVTAVLIELPIILLFAWHLCRLLIARFHLPSDPSRRLMMGLVAFVCLMSGELLIAVFLQDLRVTEFFSTFHLPENRIGLAGQIIFALFPMIEGYARFQGER